MDPEAPQSSAARDALQLVTALQRRLVEELQRVGRTVFTPLRWLRDHGVHGGGERWVSPGRAAFNTASVNVSSVHYEDLPGHPVRTATALSAIVHPDNAHAPSIHLHVSLTEPREGPGAWRIMADLNPAIPYPEDAGRFAASLRAVAPALFDDAAARGERYFHIPALGRRRGISHYYLEGHRTSDPAADRLLAETFGLSAVGCYASILEARVGTAQTEQDRAAQLAYHTLYLFQVLTLDRGTSAGLLAHAENDGGIMGSLPSGVDVALLASWRERMPDVQQPLLDRLVEALQRPRVDDDTRRTLARVVREHYRAHPEALKWQASAGL